MKTKNKPTEKQIMRYVFDHTNEDWPLDQTMDDFYEKVLKYMEMLDKTEQHNSQ